MTAGFEATIIMGLATGGTAGLIRVRSPKSWQKQKPIGCNACLSGWTALSLLLSQVVTQLLALEPTRASVSLLLNLFITWMAMTAISAVILAVAVPPPFDFSDLPPDVVEPDKTKWQ